MKGVVNMEKEEREAADRASGVSFPFKLGSRGELYFLDLVRCTFFFDPVKYISLIL